jgi:hypothetical protein
MKPEMLKDLSDTAYPRGYAEVAQKAFKSLESIHLHGDIPEYGEFEVSSAEQRWAQLFWDRVPHRKRRSVCITVGGLGHTKMLNCVVVIEIRPDPWKPIFETREWEEVGVVHLADDWSADPLLVLPKIEPQTPFMDLLEKYKDVNDLETLGSFASALIDANPVSELAHWLSRDFREWMLEGRVSLASIVEASVQLGIPEVRLPIYEILRSSSVHPQVASVAAQRVRMLPVPDRAERKELWKSLRSRIDSWAKNAETEQYAILALPSVPYVSLDDAAEWLSELISNGRPRMAEAAVLGMIDSSKRASDQPREESLTQLTKSLLRRLEVERKSDVRDNQLIAALVWSLGATTTMSYLESVVKVIVESFQRPIWTEDAAAVRAGRMLYARFQGRAMILVANQLGGIEADDWEKFQIAVLRPALVR